MTKTTCHRCNNIFEIKKLQKYNPNKYCSHLCRLKALSDSNKGRLKTTKTKKKISAKQKFLYKNKLRPKIRYWLNKKFSDSYVKKLKEARVGKSAYWNLGSNNRAWRGGVTSINNLIRKSLKYKIWRRKVFKRDNWTCVWCKKRGGKLEADHILPFAYFPKLRFKVSNGRTLCKSCHKETDTYQHKAIQLYGIIKGK